MKYTVLIFLGLVNSEGELWKTHRRFALSTLRDFGFGRPIIEPRIQDEAAHLIKAIADLDGRNFDPALLLSNATANIISNLVFGRRFDYSDSSFQLLLRRLRARSTDTVMTFMTPFVLSPTVAKIVASLPQVTEY